MCIRSVSCASELGDAICMQIPYSVSIPLDALMIRLSINRVWDGLLSVVVLHSIVFKAAL